MISVCVHDTCLPEESAIVDQGLGEANDAAAPLDEVQAISCFAKTYPAETLQRPPKKIRKKIGAL